VRVTADLDAALDGAFAHDPLVIVEAFSAGVEVECAVMGLYEAEASVPGEVVLLRGAEWYDYEAKYAEGGVRLQVPPRIPGDAVEEVRRLAVATFLRVGCAGLARVDFFVEDGRVLVNELNTLPGMTPTSAFPKLWEATGVPWPEACDRLVALALERYRAERGAHAY
jgi:D-alanine-D-alanine ligase